MFMVPVAKSGASKEEEKRPQKKRVLKVKHNEEKLKSHTLDMGILQYVFSDSVERFYAHKQLSKFYVRYQVWSWRDRETRMWTGKARA